MAEPFSPNYLNVEYFFNFIADIFIKIGHFISHTFLHALKGVLIVVAILSMAAIAYTLMRLHELNQEEKEKLRLAVKKGPVAPPTNLRWETVKAHINSTNPSDWRLAILEADLILEEVLRAMNLPGDTIGDMLKAIEPSDFPALQSAWEAHLVRNKIAHEGASFILTEHEARRVISLFELVFRDARYL